MNKHKVSSVFIFSRRNTYFDLIFLNLGVLYLINLTPGVLTCPSPNLQHQAPGGMFLVTAVTVCPAS